MPSKQIPVPNNAKPSHSSGKTGRVRLILILVGLGVGAVAILFMLELAKPSIIKQLKLIPLPDGFTRGFIIQSQGASVLGDCFDTCAKGTMKAENPSPAAVMTLERNLSDADALVRQVGWKEQATKRVIEPNYYQHVYCKGNMVLNVSSGKQVTREDGALAILHYEIEVRSCPR